ncbi:HNH endonuclease [Clostridioides sp. ES-S-0005-03]|uniref:HNH endonuclease signature motif containing protein n=1 Tax=Clostridioides sp. ES-S-0005-03 TaxID=2770774 RepID=UPI001D11C79A|nr:HNH endonuclease [Clostridioides sp. ES-S-0005-03]UDN47232.1 HNH endonuclease [Clostridioides sp. ES-S-0173-01]
MNRKSINENVKRRLYAESMGKCMNPDCQENLFIKDNDIMEKAHIAPYFETEDNSYENLIILCPNCHKKFDKINSLSEETVKKWKENRRKQLESFFSTKYGSFEELKKVVSPLLNENKYIYENYFLGDKKALWDKFEPQALSSNEKLKLLLENNMNLFQNHSEKGYSNLEVVRKFITHINEFICTRLDEEKNRAVLFPEKINSIFGIVPVKEHLMPSTESLEGFLKIMQKQNRIEEILLGIDEPYILLKDDDKVVLTDTPRLRQLYFDNKCFIKTGVRLESLNFALKYLKSRNINFIYKDPTMLREIIVNGVSIFFVYEYCLSKVFLTKMSPEPNSVIVNLHNWNGQFCISQEAYDLANTFGVTLLTIEDFYRYVNKIK